MTMRRRMIDPAALAQVLRRHPDLGDFTGITRNGLSMSTAACLFETSTGIYFAKRYDPKVRAEAALAADIHHQDAARGGLPHAQAAHQQPRRHASTWLAEQPYAIYDLRAARTATATCPCSRPTTPTRRRAPPAP